MATVTGTVEEVLQILSDKIATLEARATAAETALAHVLFRNMVVQGQIYEQTWPDALNAAAQKIRQLGAEQVNPDDQQTANLYATALATLAALPKDPDAPVKFSVIKGGLASD